MDSRAPSPLAACAWPAMAPPFLAAPCTRNASLFFAGGLLYSFAAAGSTLRSLLILIPVGNRRLGGRAGGLGRTGRGGAPRPPELLADTPGTMPKPCAPSQPAAGAVTRSVFIACGEVSATAVRAAVWLLEMPLPDDPVTTSRQYPTGQPSDAADRGRWAIALSAADSIRMPLSDTNSARCGRVSGTLHRSPCLRVAHTAATRNSIIASYRAQLSRHSGHAPSRASPTMPGASATAIRRNASTR